MSNTEVLVIGSGIGGLSCAALLASYGLDVTVCESHSIPGGAAHGFDRAGFRFDSGPSLYSGLSYRPSPNPLRQVLDAIDESLPCLPYKTWGCWLPEGYFAMDVGADQFCQVLQSLRGDRAVQEWRELQRVMLPLSQAAIALPLAALRWDAGALLTVGRYLPALFQHAPAFLKVTGAFDRIMNSVVQDPFIRNWLNLLCFMLSGLPAAGTSAAEMAFMFADWYRPEVVLDYPIGGSAALVDALVRGLQKHGGRLLLNAHVSAILVDRDRAVGVRLRDGQEIRAGRAVVTNAAIWDTLKLLPDAAIAGAQQRSSGWRTAPLEALRQRQHTPACHSFMHLHLGIDATGIDPELPCHHMIVNDWQLGVTAPQNVVAVSIPSLLDRSLAPPGKHVIHAYTPATEPYDLWAGLDRRSSAYVQQKQERSQVMWQALERFIPDVRDRCEVTLVGTPLTHERFLRRYQGSYGPAWSASTGLFPAGTTPIANLFCCGDSTFPGIGLPAVAASGMIAANSIAPVQKHLDLLASLD